MSFLVVGEFTPGNRLSDAIKVRELTLGRAFALSCPEHTLTYPITYYWGSSQVQKYRIIQENKNRMLLNGGKVLFFSVVTQEDVDFITKLKGISCIVNSNGEEMFSVRHKLKVVDSKLFSFSVNCYVYCVVFCFGIY